MRMGWFVRDLGRWTRAVGGGVAVWTLYICYICGLATSSVAARTPQAAAPPAAQTTVWSGVYNAAQVKRGEALSIQKCVICHGDELLGGEAPTLVGPDFVVHWNRHTAWEL